MCARAIELHVDSVARCAAAWQRDRHFNADERERARTIASPERRAQFLAGRWLAVQSLVARHGGSHEDWHLSCIRGHAPHVIRGPARTWLSIAHCGDSVICGLADRPVGVDIELDDRLHGATEERADFVLAAAERPAFAQTPPDARAAFLLSRWTLKEAWAKRQGCGLALGAMRGLESRPLAQGGNARLWRAAGLIVALCAEEGDVWPQPNFAVLAAAPAEPWQVGPINPRQ